MKIEEREALEECASHYGMPVFLKEVDAIIELIKGNILSVSLDKDPEKASFQLYAERMKLEGAIAVKNALKQKVESIKRSAKS